MHLRVGIQKWRKTSFVCSVCSMALCLLMSFYILFCMNPKSGWMSLPCTSSTVRCTSRSPQLRNVVHRLKCGYCQSLTFLPHPQIAQVEQQLREELTLLRGEHRTLTLSSAEHAARTQSLQAEVRKTSPLHGGARRASDNTTWLCSPSHPTRGCCFLGLAGLSWTKTIVAKNEVNQVLHICDRCERCASLGEDVVTSAGSSMSAYSGHCYSSSSIKIW